MNRIDIAKADIFNGEESFTPDQLSKILELALIENRPEFVELLLQNGADLSCFLTYDRLYYLYNSYRVLPDSKRAPLFEFYKLKYNCTSDRIFVTFKRLKHLLRSVVEKSFDSMKFKFLPKDLNGIRDDDEEVEVELKKYLVCIKEKFK